MFRFVLFIFISLNATYFINGKDLTIDFALAKGKTVEIVNLSGKVDVRVNEEENENNNSAKLTASSSEPVLENEIKLSNNRGNILITVAASSGKKNIDLIVDIPKRSNVKVTTDKGEVRLQGNVDNARIITVTGTIAVDVPTSDLRYNLSWLASRPRFLADFELSKVQERTAGKFEIKGNFKSSPEADNENDRVTINLTTERGILLINVPPNEVTADLRERPLTKAAKTIVRSGDSSLVEAIRRASPKYFGEYISSLPPYRRPPELIENSESAKKGDSSSINLATLRVIDSNNRAVTGITSDDIEILEDGRPREILSIRQIKEPVNLVLLLDVSGSVDNYVNFIRKAARNFVETVDKEDRISILTFNEDINVLSTFTTDKEHLSTSLDSFDAGGGTAYYDALAYTLVESITPLKGERTAIVIITDGDDNRSFIPFDPLISALQETGVLIYPLYVPSSLIAASESNRMNSNVDPLRSRYMGLSQRAEGEGERLAKASGGVYYSISQLSHLQEAYDDITLQLRTAYEVQYRSEINIENQKRVSPRVSVRVNNPNIFANIISLSAETRR